MPTVVIPSAGHGRRSAGGQIVDEASLEVGVRIDPTRHDQVPPGVHDPGSGTGTEPAPHLDDPLPSDPERRAGSSRRRSRPALPE